MVVACRIGNEWKSWGVFNSCWKIYSVGWIQRVRSASWNYTECINCTVLSLSVPISGDCDNPVACAGRPKKNNESEVPRVIGRLWALLPSFCFSVSFNSLLSSMVVQVADLRSTAFCKPRNSGDFAVWPWCWSKSAPSVAARMRFASLICTVAIVCVYACFWFQFAQHGPTGCWVADLRSTVTSL